MSDNFWRIHKGLNFTPQTSTPLNPLSGDFWYDSATSKFLARVAAVSDPIVTEAANQALTNKTFNASLNTLSNIINTNISNSAAIAYSKLNLSLSIVNGDVSATAAIDGTKISPNFGSQDIITTGNARIGRTTYWSAPNERLTVYRNYTGVTSNTHIGATLATDLNTNDALTSGTNSGALLYFRRVVSDNVTDTAAGGYSTTASTFIDSAFSIASGKTLTFTNGYSKLNIRPISIASGGSLATNVYGVNIASDSIAITGSKVGLLIDPQSGGSVGNWQLYSAGTAPSFLGGPLEWKQQSTPSNPSAGNDRLYFKSDNNLYRLTSAGVETLISSSPFFEVTTVTSDTVMSSTTDVLLVNKSSAAAITLPTVVNGKQVVIKDISGAAQTNNITITRAGSALIDGQVSLILNLNYQAVELVSDGSNWWIK